MTTASNIVVEWLRSQHLNQYSESFIDNGYDDLEICKQISDPDLDAIGVFNQTHRSRLLQSVKTLREEGAASVYFTLEKTSDCLCDNISPEYSRTSSERSASKKEGLRVSPTTSSSSGGHELTKFADEYEEGKAELVRIPRMQLRMLLQEKLHHDGIRHGCQPYNTSIEMASSSESSRGTAQEQTDDESSTDTSNSTSTKQQEEAQLKELLQAQHELETKLSALWKRWEDRHANIQSDEQSPEEISHSGHLQYNFRQGLNNFGDPELQACPTFNIDPSSSRESKTDDATLVDSFSPTNSEAQRLIDELRNRPPPRLLLPKPTKVSASDVYAENLTRNRIPARGHSSCSVTEKGASSNKNLDVEIAPSVMTKPLPARSMPSFRDVLEIIGAPSLATPRGEKQPLYMADCRIITQEVLKTLITKRAEALVERLESTKVDRGTQTFITQVGKQHVVGCVNCKSKEHHFKDCQLPYRPGFCRICGADGFDTEDCIYPHGVEHEQALGRCPGCARDLELYCPECPDCNIRHEGLVDWLRLNYATWPTAWIPEDHRHLTNEGDQSLKKKYKDKFDRSGDYANRVRGYLLRENALFSKPPSNPEAKMAVKMSEEKRRRAVKVLYSPEAQQTLDDIMAERPEHQEGEKLSRLSGVRQLILNK